MTTQPTITVNRSTSTKTLSTTATAINATPSSNSLDVNLVTPVISATSSNTGAFATTVSTPDYQVNVVGLGGEFVPSPELFKYQPEIANALSEFSAQVGKIADNDNAVASDVASYSLSKVASSDISYAQDYISIVCGFVRDYQDSAAASDAVAISTAKPFSDSASRSDRVTIDIAKYMPENISAIETFSIAVSIGFSENRYFASDYCAEDYVLQGPIALDVVSLAPTKGVADTSNASDYCFITISPVKADSILVSELITANKQSYFASDFAQPGYVGTNHSLN